MKTDLLKICSYNMDYSLTLLHIVYSIYDLMTIVCIILYIVYMTL